MITILIVDDEPLIRSGIRYALEEMTFKMTVLGEAENGEDAFEKYQQLLPDVIITDVKMPAVNGLQLIEKIRRIDEMTQFIIVSGYADFEYAQTAIKQGVTQYVLKPIKTKELEDAIRQCAIHLEKCYDEVLPESEQLVRYLKEHYTEALTLDILAKKFNFNSQYVSQMIKTKVGQGFSDYLITLRLKQATELLTKTDLEIKEIAQRVGYDDQQYFHRIFKRRLNKTPALYRREMGESR